MRITDTKIFPEESQGTIILETLGTTRATLAGTGVFTFTSAIASLSATGISTTGVSQIGGATDTVGFFGATAVAVQATTATSGTHTSVLGASATSGSSWTGNTGTKSYTVGDIVSALKKYGLLTA